MLYLFLRERCHDEKAGPLLVNSEIPLPPADGYPSTWAVLMLSTIQSLHVFTRVRIPFSDGQTRGLHILTELLNARPNNQDGTHGLVPMKDAHSFCLDDVERALTTAAKVSRVQILVPVQNSNRNAGRLTNDSELVVGAKKRSMAKVKSSKQSQPTGDDSFILHVLKEARERFCGDGDSTNQVSVHERKVKQTQVVLEAFLDIGSKGIGTRWMQDLVKQQSQSLRPGEQQGNVVKVCKEAAKKWRDSAEAKKNVNRDRGSCNGMLLMLLVVTVHDQTTFTSMTRFLELGGKPAKFISPSESTTDSPGMRVSTVIRPMYATVAS